jgi:hypothetical protein
MSKDLVAFNPKQLPAFAKKRETPSALSKALAGSGGGGYQHKLSIKGGVFRLLAAGKEIASIEERYLDVVFIAASPKVGRIYYGVKFSESETAAPKCQSVDGVKPDASVAQKQSETCATCPMNIKGSGEGETKGCRYYQRVALVLANDLEGNVLQLTVPSKSIFGKEEGGNYPLQAYARWLDAQGIDPDIVITRIKFDTRESAPKLYFRTMRYLSDEEFASVQSVAAGTAAKNAVDNVSDGAVESEPTHEEPKGPQFPPDDDADTAPPPPPAPKGRKPKAKPTTQPDDEAAEEPQVRKPAAPTTAKPSPSLASVVADWDTDD